MPGTLISLAKSGKEKGAYPVNSLHAFIGSHPSSVLRIQNEEVSPKHCVITAPINKPASIKNLSRTLPTLLNGKEIGLKYVQLTDNDVITIKNYTFKWKYDTSSKFSNSPKKSIKGRKSCPLAQSISDEVKPKLKRITIAAGITSSKKEKVIGLKSGVKRLDTSFTSNKSVKRLSPAAGRSSNASQPSNTRKSVKFFDSLFLRKLGRRHNLSYAPPTPYRPGITPGKGKMSLYFTPPSTLGGRGKPTKGILKTPGSASISSITLAPSLADLSKTPPGLPEIIVSMETSTVGLKTPPRQESPEVIMRSSRRTGGIGRKPSPDRTPKSISKKRSATDQSLEASERAAKKLKADPPRAIDKKKMAALLQCHRKSLTPHPAVERHGRLLPLPSPGPVTTQSSPQHPPAKGPLPTTPTSTKRPSVKSRASGPTPYSNVVPRSLSFGSLSNSGPVAKKKKKKPFRPINLERKYPFGRSPVAKMSVSPQPPQRKMTRASRAERASKESAIAPRRDATDVLSALDLSRKNPPAPKPTSPIADFANASGIKELFSEKAVDVRELFGAGDEVSEADPTASANHSLRQSKRISEKGTSELSTSNISIMPFNIEGAEELPVSSFSLNASQALSTSRRSLSLKSSKTSSLRSSTLIPDVELSSSPSGLGSSLKTSSEPENLSSDFSLGSFNSSYYKSVNSSHLLTPTPDNGAKTASFRRSIAQRLLKTISPKKHQISPSIHKRLSLRRVALNTHTKQMLQAHLSMAKSPQLIDLTQDNSNEFTPSSRGARKSGSDSFRSLPSSGVTSFHSESLNTADGSHMSKISMNVHVDDLESAVSLDRNQVNCTPAQINLSKSASFGHSSPKVLPSLSYSAPGKIDKPLRKKTPVKHTRSSSSINIDLSKLDKIPTDIPSSTPFKSKTKGTRTKGSGFELENFTNSSDVGSVESRLFETSSIVRESSRGYLNETKNESGRKWHYSFSSNQSLHFKSTRRRSSVNIDLDEKKHNKPSLKSTPSRSLSLINESSHNLEASMKRRNNMPQMSELNISFAKSQPSKTSPKSTEEQRSSASPSFLDSKRSSRSRSSINLNLFDLDKKPDIKNISKPSNSSYKSAKASILSPLSANEQGQQDISLGASERRYLSGRSSLETKSTKSKSSVNNNLFSLDEKPGSRQSARTPLKNESLRGLTTESVSKSSKRVSPVSAKSCESIFSPSTSFSNNKRDSPFVHGSRINLSRKSNRSLLNERDSNPDDKTVNTGSPKIETPKRIVNQIVSSQNSNANIENKENTPRKSSLRVSQASLKNGLSSSISSLTPSKKSNTDKVQRELLTAHGNRSTRSNSSVSINLFKLDETEKTPIERRQGKHVMLQTSVSNETKLDSATSSVSKAHASTQMSVTPRVISVRSKETQTSVERSHGIRKSYILYKVPIVNSSIPVCECNHEINCVRGRRLLTDKEIAEPGPKSPKIQESFTWSSNIRLHSESKSRKKSLEPIHSDNDKTSIAVGSPSRKKTSLQKGKVLALRLSKGKKKVVSSAIVKSVQHLPSSNESFSKVDSSTENESSDRSVKGKLTAHALKNSSSKKVISSKIVTKTERPLGAVGARKSAEESSGESAKFPPCATKGKKTANEPSLTIPKPPVEDTQPSPKAKRGRKAAANEPSLVTPKPSTVSKRGKKADPKPPVEDTKPSPKPNRGKKAVANELSLAIPKPSPVSKRGKTARLKLSMNGNQPSPKAKRGRKAVANEPSLVILKPSPVSKKGRKASPKPPVEDTRPSPKPKRGRKAAANEPLPAISKPSPVSKKGKKTGSKPPVEESKPSPKPNRGRKAAANEQSLAIPKPSPVSKRGNKEGPKPPVKDAKPSPKPKRGRKAAANEPSLVIHKPSPVPKRGRKADPKPPVEDTQPSPKPKRSRKAAVEPSLTIPKPSPVSKRGRKADPKPPVEDTHPSPKPKRGNKAAAEKPSLVIPKPSPVSKRGRKADPKPPVEDTRPSPKTKRGRKAAANEPSQVIPKPSPVSKRGRKADPKPPVEDTLPSPKPKRGNKAAAEEPLVEEVKSSPVSKRGRKAVVELTAAKSGRIAADKQSVAKPGKRVAFEKSPRGVKPSTVSGKQSLTSSTVAKPGKRPSTESPMENIKPPPAKRVRGAASPQNNKATGKNRLGKSQGKSVTVPTQAPIKQDDNLNENNNTKMPGNARAIEPSGPSPPARRTRGAGAPPQKKTSLQKETTGKPNLKTAMKATAKKQKNSLTKLTAASVRAIIKESSTGKKIVGAKSGKKNK